MPARYYPSNNSCDYIYTVASEICFTIEDCTPSCTEYLVNVPAQIYNCSRRQTDPVYFHPYVAGDVIHIQTQFKDRYNPDPENPVDGFGTWLTVALYDLSNPSTPVSSDYTTFTTAAMVAHTGEISYQILEIDTSSLPDCWAIEITPRRAGDVILTDEILESQHFQRATCENTVLLSSYWPKSDCCGNYYGTPVGSRVGDLISYSNANRFWGNFLETGGGVSKTLFDTGIANSSTNIREYTLGLSKPIAPFAKNILQNQIIAAKFVYIEDELFEIDNFSLDNKMQMGRAFLFDVVFEQTCEKSFFCD